MRRVLIVLLVLSLFAAVAVDARVGGGGSYSGGGGSSSGGGDGDGLSGELLYFLFRILLWLTMEYPAIGIPVDIIVIVILVRWWQRKNSPEVLTVSTGNVGPRGSREARNLDALRKFDPNFSEITFSDFCYSLYAKAHHARGAGDLDRYAPYLSDLARNTLRSQSPAGLKEVRGVIIGAMKVISVRGLDTPEVTAMVLYESNYTEVTAAGEQSYYVKEQWMFVRQRDILSPPPEKAKADHCPRCGAALQTRTDGACNYCGVKIDSGTFQWFVQAITPRERESRGPLLTSDVPERGTELPTVYQSRYGDERKAFLAAHPEFQWQHFDQLVRNIAVKLQDAWTARDWERVRPLETESLFQMHRYWIDAYTRQRLSNVVADYRIMTVEPVKIENDAFYEAITVRMFAQGRDYTVDESGRVVAGSKSNVRKWSEYWTLIRTRTANAGSGKRSCPNCGAPVAVGNTGICEHCGGKLTSGEFDWLLSKIEQDESYRG